MADHPQLQLDAQLCFPLYAATRAVTGAYADLLAPAGLTYPQYLTVLALGGSDEAMTVGDLGRALRLDSGTLTPLLKRLEAAGHVERHRDPADERRVLVALTPQGRALRDSLAGVPQQMGERMGLTLAEVGELRRLLGGLLAGLDDR